MEADEVDAGSTVKLISSSLKQDHLGSYSHPASNSERFAHLLSKADLINCYIVANFCALCESHTFVVSVLIISRFQLSQKLTQILADFLRFCNEISEVKTSLNLVGQINHGLLNASYVSRLI